MKLHFKSTPVGFILDNGDIGKYTWGEIQSSLNGESYTDIGDGVLSDRDGQILWYSYSVKYVGFSLTQYYEKILDYDIPGAYTVPELELDEASFAQVIQTIVSLYTRETPSRSQGRERRKSLVTRK